MRLTLSLIPLFLFFGCITEETEDVPEHLKHIDNLTIYPVNLTPAADIELIREATYGETEEVFFGRIIEKIAVDYYGRVYIADLTENKIHIYNSDGSYLQNLGRGGQGPGEFQAIWDLEIFDEKIHLLDYRQFKISVFDLTTFDHIRDYDISLHNQQDNQPAWLDWTRQKGLFYKPTNFFVTSDSTYLILFSDDTVGSAQNVDGRTYEVSVYNPQLGEYTDHDLLSFEWTGQVLAHEESGRLMVFFGVPYKRSSQFDFSNNRFVHGWTEELLLKYYDRNGTPQESFYYHYSNAQLHYDDVISHYEDASEQVIHALRSDERPETWPAFHSLTLDDINRLWVSTIVDNQEIYEWWILDQAGELIAKFSWPRNRDLKQVKNGYAYTIERDNETGLKEVIKYNIKIGI